MKTDQAVFVVVKRQAKTYQPINLVSRYLFDMARAVESGANA
jgi:hypothetical protein